jgi:hypothetical protein
MTVVDVECNLLFGLLALRHGLIDQDEILDAFRSWTLDKARPVLDFDTEFPSAMGRLQAPRMGPINIVQLEQHV